MNKILWLMSFLIIYSSCAKGAKNSEARVLENNITWKLGHIAAENHPWQDISLFFADKVQEYSEGTVTVEVFPNSQLGSEVDNINGIRGGTADMTLTGETLQNWAPLAALMAVPYAFKDELELKSMVDSSFGDKISQDISTNAGLKTLFYILRAPRNLTANRPIRTPDDLHGLRLRVPNVPIFVETWKALGARPTPMAFQEVFTALQQNTIEGQENPYDLIYSAGFYEVQKYVNKTEHVRQWLYVVVGQKQWDELNQAQEAAVLKASSESQEYAYQVYKTGLSKYRQLLLDEGMEIIEVDQDAFRQQAEVALKDALSAEQLLLLQEISSP